MQRSRARFGAEGIGLCRTEHMFFEGDRIDYVRQMILGSLDYKQLEREIADVENEVRRPTAPKKREELARARRELKQEIEEPKRMYKGGLDQLLKLQRKDFEGIFKAMDGLPVTIRTLDPPLHEFLPHDEEGTRKLARKLKVKPQHLWSRVQSLHEANPMLGHRGCRLGVVFPEITEMQARAIFEAAARVQKKGVKVLPEIMIPLVSDVNELKLQADVVRRVAAEVMEETRAEDRVSGRHDDRASARGADGGQDRRGGRVLLVRDERSDADDLWNIARRFGQVPAVLR